MHRSSLLAALLIAALAPAAGAQVPESPVAPARDTEPIILKGNALGTWSAPANQTVKLPFMDLAGTEACSTKIDPTKLDPSKVDPSEFDPTENGIGVPDPSGATGGAVAYDPNKCPPADYAKPEIDTAQLQNQLPVRGADVDRLIGYRYDLKAGGFRQIPFQVDEVFTRYLDNSRSGFALYSGQDQQTTYAYDREGFRYTDSAPDNPCKAIPRMVNGVRLKALPDPIPGLDDNDEVAFMYSDTGPAAPSDAPLPAGTVEARRVTVADPFGTREPRYVYVMLAAPKNGARPAYDASNGYVGYRRDANADEFAFSESSYNSYGNAPPGQYCSDPRPGKPQQGVGQRRPLDGATIATNRYRFRYDGRWLLTRVEISPDEGSSFGPDLVDRWKARAFAQDPSSNTPCCGYEEEDSNWGGSSILLGEKVGPVRAIRETWGADSGTNVVRRESFYRNEMRQRTWLRVHVIPPLDGIYAQWDFNAGRVDTFFNPRADADGWAIDGKNDEVFGNLDDPCNSNYNQYDGDRDELTRRYRQLYQSLKFGGYSWCDQFPYSQSVDLPDPTVSDANAALSWSMVTGDNGTIVDRTSATIEDLAPAGVAQSVLAVPYYRDDACFDDGTGSDPGPELFPRNPREELKSGAGGKRSCWRGNPAVPNSDPRFWQGSIATHGLHILFLADSDNARQTVPVSEIVAETRMVMLPGRRGGTAGERYGRGFEKPAVTAATPAAFLPSLFGQEEPAPGPAKEPEQTPAPPANNHDPQTQPENRPGPSRQPTAEAAASPARPGVASTPPAKAKAKAKRKAKAKAKRKSCKAKKGKARKRCLKRKRQRG